MNQLTSPYIFTTPGKLQHAKCRVCGQQATIERDVAGATGLAEAMAGIQKRHDRVRCPHQGEPWHLQAQRMQQECQATASPRLKALIRSDLDELLERHRGA